MLPQTHWHFTLMKGCPLPAGVSSVCKWETAVLLCIDSLSLQTQLELVNEPYVIKLDTILWTRVSIVVILEAQLMSFLKWHRWKVYSGMEPLCGLHSSRSSRTGMCHNPMRLETSCQIGQISNQWSIIAPLCADVGWYFSKYLQAVSNQAKIHVSST